MNNDYYKDRCSNLQERIEDLESKKNTMQLSIDNKNTIIGWSIALNIILLIFILIAITNSSTINNNGYTIEQVTNATIQICKALR